MRKARTQVMRATMLALHSFVIRFMVGTAAVAADLLNTVVCLVIWEPHELNGSFQKMLQGRRENHTSRTFDDLQLSLTLCLDLRTTAGNGPVLHIGLSQVGRRANTIKIVFYLARTNDAHVPCTHHSREQQMLSCMLMVV